MMKSTALTIGASEAASTEPSGRSACLDISMGAIMSIKDSDNIGVVS